VSAATDFQRRPPQVREWPVCERRQPAPRKPALNLVGPHKNYLRAGVWSLIPADDSQRPGGPGSTRAGEPPGKGRSLTESGRPAAACARPWNPHHVSWLSAVVASLKVAGSPLAHVGSCRGSVQFQVVSSRQPTVAALGRGHVQGQTLFGTSPAERLVQPWFAGVPHVGKRGVPPAGEATPDITRSSPANAPPRPARPLRSESPHVDHVVNSRRGRRQGCALFA